MYDDIDQKIICVYTTAFGDISESIKSSIQTPSPPPSNLSYHQSLVLGLFKLGRDKPPAGLEPRSKSSYVCYEQMKHHSMDPTKILKVDTIWEQNNLTSYWLYKFAINAKLNNIEKDVHFES